MNRNILFKKMLVFIIIALFFCVSVVPCFCVVSEDVEEQSVVPLGERSVTCYFFDRLGNGESSVVLSSVDFDRFFSVFEELNYLVAFHPFSDETKDLKLEFVDLLDGLGLIPEGFSKVGVISLMSPVFNNHGSLFSLPSVSGGRGSAFFCNFATLGEGSQFPVIILPRLIPFLLLPIPRVIMHWDAYDGVTSCGGLLSGKGFIALGAQQGTALGFWGVGFSVFLPPVMSFGFIGYALFATATADEIVPWPPNRPPVVSDENPVDGAVDVPVDLSELSFRIQDLDGDRMNYSVTSSPGIGSGSGVGVSDGTFSVDVGGLNSDTEYSWHVVVSDGEDVSEEVFSFHTAVEAPFVSDPVPVDGDSWVSVDLSELVFSLKDLQGDSMDFTVETSPDIGSDSGVGVGNGTFSVSVGGLDYSTDYVWFVNVTDGVFWTRRFFVFRTQPLMVFDPFDEGWLYRKQVVVNHSLVVGDLVDFPVLVSVVDSDLVVHAQFDGDDVLFMDGVGVASRLLHEIEFFDGSSGELVAWVNLTSLSSTVDTILYMYYGNPSCNSQQFPKKVWDNGYCGVWHLADLKDSTSNDNDGTNHGTNPITGKIGDARDFEKSSSEYIDWGDMPEPANNEISTGTFEMWVKPDELNCVPISKFDSRIEPDKSSYFLSLTSDGKIYYRADSGTWYPDHRLIITVTNEAFITTGNWQHVAAVVDLSVQNMDLYYNGQEKNSTKTVEGSPPLYFYDIALSEQSGRHPHENGVNFYEGIIDEIRISKICRSSSWISTEYNNQNDPSSFLSFGLEETPP